MCCMANPFIYFGWIWRHLFVILSGAKVPLWEVSAFCRRLIKGRPCTVPDRLDLADVLDIIETSTVYFTSVTPYGTVYILIFTLFLLTGLLSFSTVLS